MTDELVKRRDEVMEAAWKALDAAWPERKGDEYVRTMQWAVKELETIGTEMRRQNIDPVEQSRTYRHLGSLYADLQPAAGDQMLLDAKRSYEAAEILLENQPDELERAKLRFNFANTLRLIDANNVTYLDGAKQRLVAARAYFAANAPQSLPQVDAALQSVESLLSIAPLANSVRQDVGEMAELQQKLAAGDDTTGIAARMREVMRRGGGPAGVAARLQAIIDALPAETKRTDKFAEVQQVMRDITRRILGNSLTDEDERVLSLLTARLKADAVDKVSRDRARSLENVLDDFARIVSGEDTELDALVDKAQRMRDFVAAQLEMAHYLSHGIDRPPAGSRASEMVEQNWQLRRYLLEEMHRPDKGEQESKECLDLNMRASRVDRRIYEAGVDDGVAVTVKREELQPLAVAVRAFSARMQTMPAWPIWGSTRIPIDTNAAFHAGPAQTTAWIAAACRRAGLELMGAPADEGHAAARWKQLQKALTAIFDFRVEPGPGLGAVAYELGIALALGRPAVALVAEHQNMPFDVEIEPVVCSGGPGDEAALAAAIDRSIVWTFPRPDLNASRRTLDQVLSSPRPPSSNPYVDQTFKLLERLREHPDPLAISRTLAKLFEYLDGTKTMLVHPRWLPVYPDRKGRRLFHVMPFRPRWAKEVTALTRKTCQAANITYVRGDEVEDPNVIRSIWDEIARASHVLVDLSGFNPNVALELGIAHTLGKKVLLVGQDGTVEELFPSVRKLRLHTYSVKRLRESLARAVASFVAS